MSVLDRPCRACGVAYGDHTLEGLAECVEGLLDDGQWHGPVATVTTITGDTLETIL